MIVSGILAEYGSIDTGLEKKYDWGKETFMEGLDY